MENSVYRELVLNIYRAASEPDHWSAVLGELADRMGAVGCIVYEIASGQPDHRIEAPLISSGLSRSQVESYLDKYQEFEVRDHETFDRNLLKTDDIVMLNEDILYDDQSEYLERPHVKRLLELGIHHRTGALLDKDNPFRARFSLSMAKGKGILQPDDALLLNDLLPHVAKAIELGRPAMEQHQQSKALMLLIDRLDLGVCILDAKGRVFLKNTEFVRQVEEFRKFQIDRNDTLMVNDLKTRDQFSKMLTDLTQHGRFGARPRKESLMMETAGQEGALCVEIVPMNRSDLIGSAPFNGAIVFSRDTRKPVRIDLELAQKTYGFTDAEVEVVRLVCDGLTNSQIAERREVSVQTVNAQMKAVLTKAGATNRTHLVRLLCNFSLPGAFWLGE